MLGRMAMLVMLPALAFGMGASHESPMEMITNTGINKVFCERSSDCTRGEACEKVCLWEHPQDVLIGCKITCVRRKAPTPTAFQKFNDRAFPTTPRPRPRNTGRFGRVTTQATPTTVRALLPRPAQPPSHGRGGGRVHPRKRTGGQGRSSLGKRVGGFPGFTPPPGEGGGIRPGPMGGPRGPRGPRGPKEAGSETDLDPNESPEERERRLEKVAADRRLHLQLWKRWAAENDPDNRLTDLPQRLWPNAGGSGRRGRLPRPGSGEAPSGSFPPAVNKIRTPLLSTKPEEGDAMAGPSSPSGPATVAVPETHTSSNDGGYGAHCGRTPICGRGCGVALDDEGCLTCRCLTKGPRKCETSHDCDQGSQECSGGMCRCKEDYKESRVNPAQCVPRPRTLPPPSLPEVPPQYGEYDENYESGQEYVGYEGGAAQTPAPYSPSDPAPAPKPRSPGRSDPGSSAGSVLQCGSSSGGCGSGDVCCHMRWCDGASEGGLCDEGSFCLTPVQCRIMREARKSFR